MRITQLENLWIVSIPQAVSAVATFLRSFLRFFILKCFNTASGKRCCNAYTSYGTYQYDHARFNTASGKRCCNDIKEGEISNAKLNDVSIPQAVSAVATQ